MKIKGYYWAIVAAAIVVVLAIVVAVLFSISKSSSSADSAHTADQLASYQSIDNTPRIEAFKDLLNENPNDLMVLDDLGTIYMQLGQYQEARDVFERAVAVNPNDPNFYGGLAEAYYSMRMVDLSNREIDRGLAIDPNSQYLVILKGDILATQGKTEEAKVLYQKAYDTNPTTYYAQVAQDRLTGGQGSSSTGGSSGGGGGQNPHETGEIPLQ